MTTDPQRADTTRHSPTVPRGPGFSRSSAPAIPGGDWPAPESRRRKALIRGGALWAVALSFGYLGWRLLGGTIALDYWWIAIPFYVVEAHNGLGVALYTLALWDVDAGPRWRPVSETPHRVAVLLTTLNEPGEVLLPAIAAAVALEPAHETWVLDDGARPEIEELATSLGARYLARHTSEHAKAGNLNHALGVVEADIVAVLDADHVARADLLRHTLGYFDDPEVGLVQTPQDFYNHDSFEHHADDGSAPFYEEAVFYRVIAPAKNRWKAAFWCGTGALLRTEALRSVGGVATGSLTEDIHTSLRMSRRGWRGVYHNEVLARGIAPRNVEQYARQRHRWAAGAMQVLRLENPFFSRGLTLGQRLSFLTTLLGWFDSWRLFAFMVLPVLVLVTGAVPIAAPGLVYGPLFVAAFLAQFAALRLLARGYYPPVMSLLFEVLRMPAVLPATFAAVGPQRVRSFAVTGKHREAGVARVPPLLWQLVALTLAGNAWFALTLAGLTPTSYPVLPVALAALAFAQLNLALLAAAMWRIRHPRYRGDSPLRALTVWSDGMFGESACHLTGWSLDSLRLSMPRAPQDGATSSPGVGQQIVLSVPEGLVAQLTGPRGWTARPPTVVQGRVAAVHAAEATEIEIALDPGQVSEIGRLIVALVNGVEDVHLEVAQPIEAGAA